MNAAEIIRAPVMPWRPMHGLPAFLTQMEAGAAGEHDDATVGLVMAPDPRPGFMAMPWFWNPEQDEWQASHILNAETSPSSGGFAHNDLRGIAELWYANASEANQAKIASVPQNAAILGADARETDHRGDDFDVILIPGLDQPPLPPAVSGKPGGGVPGGEISPGIPGLPSPEDITPVGERAPPAPAAEAEAFWTPGKVAVAAGVGAVALGGIVYFATRKRRRR